ncbi:MAG: hypothetical protein JHD28_00920 [Bacteroidia bacterium]|nr:hypothetical protein [Bacteroidia bacterium]
MEITINIENKMLYKSLLNLLKTMGVSAKKESNILVKDKKKYPFEGSIIKYDQPFDSASDINDWHILQ